MQANLSDSSGDWMAEVKDATKVPWTRSGVFWLGELISGATPYKTGCIDAMGVEVVQLYVNWLT